jgi:regulatory protein
MPNYEDDFDDDNAFIEDDADTPNHRLIKIKNICLRLLTRREHSQQELLNKLSIKGYSKDLVLPILEELAEQGWQSDQRYAESYARNCILRGYGSIYIIYNLQQNGVNHIELDDIVEATVGSWMAQIQQVYSRKYDDSPVTNRSEWAKRSRFLLQRGFSGTLISDLFDELKG